MRHILITILSLVGFFVMGCKPSQPAPESTARFVTDFVKYRPRFSLLGVYVDSTNRQVHFLTKDGESTPREWSASPGWFIYFESTTRVWAYDGNTNLLMYACEPGRQTMYGTYPGSKPFPLPAPMIAKLDGEFRRVLGE